MAPLLDLPSELHLSVFEAVTDLGDLINLLQSSGQLSELFRRHFDGLMRATIIPRICPSNVTAVEQALQAACSNVGLRYHYWAEEPELGGQWEFPAHRDIWDGVSDGLLDPVDVLQHLRAMSVDVNGFLRIVKNGKGHIYWTANRFGDAALEDALWEVQAHTSRVANLRAIQLHGDCTHSRRNTHNARWSTAEEWYQSLASGKSNPLYRLFKIAHSVDQHLRRHLLVPARDGLLFRMAYGLEHAQVRLENRLSLPPGRSISVAIAFVAGIRPVVLRPSDDTAYESFCRDIRLKPEAQDPASVQRLRFINTGVFDDRTAKVRANLAAYLENMRPVMQTVSTEGVDIVAQMGLYHRETARMVYGGTVLEKHLGIASRGNRHGDQPVDVDDILPDMTQCLNAAVSKWHKVRSLERSTGIARRPVLHDGLSFSGVAEAFRGFADD